MCPDLVTTAWQLQEWCKRAAGCGGYGGLDARRAASDISGLGDSSTMAAAIWQVELMPLLLLVKGGDTIHPGAEIGSPPTPWSEAELGIQVNPSFQSFH